MDISEEKDVIKSKVIELTKKCADIQIMNEYLHIKIGYELINLQNFQERKEKEVDAHKQDLCKKRKSSIRITKK